MDKQILIGMLMLVLEYKQRKDKDDGTFLVGQKMLQTPDGEIRFFAPVFDRIIFNLFRKTTSTP
jgi:hypothetical protein